jgi:hypothetical protein
MDTCGRSYGTRSCFPKVEQCRVRIGGYAAPDAPRIRLSADTNARLPSMVRSTSRKQRLWRSFHSRIVHDCFIPFVSLRFRWPYYPSEHDDFFVLSIYGPPKGCDFTFRHIIAPRFNHSQGSVITKHICGFFRNLQIRVPILLGNRGNESVNVWFVFCAHTLQR